MQRSERSYWTIFLVSFLLLSACQVKEKDDGSLRDRLSRKKTELKELRSSIDSLERRIRRKEKGDSGSRAGALVRIKEMRPVSFEHHFTVNGAVEAAQEVLLSAERQGTLEKIFVEEGDRVEKGELVAKQDQEVLRTRLEEVKTRYEHAKTLYEKQKRLWKEQGIGSELDYLNAKNKMETLFQKKRSLEKELDMTRIKAPISGTVEELRLKEGAFAAPSNPIAHIIGIDKLYVEADLSERYLPDLQEGDTVHISFPILDLAFRRPIQSLGDRIAPQDRTFKVRAKIRNNEENAIKPNLSASLRFTDLSTDSALVIPSEIVQSDPKGDHVYVVGPSDTARKRYIELGPSQGHRSLVRKGLKVGDRVVVAGQDELSEGVKVRLEKEVMAKRRKQKR